MSFIDTIAPANATGEVAELYRREQGQLPYLPNYARVFCHRPGLMRQWARLQKSLREHLDDRTYSLISLAAAMASGNSYCSLAHARLLASRGYSEAQVAAIVRNEEAAPLSAAERAMMRLAAAVARSPASITDGDIQLLREAGYSDPEIFDIVAAAAGRCFFARIPDALGVQPDRALGEAAGSLKDILSVGRPVAAEVEATHETEKEA